MAPPDKIQFLETSTSPKDFLHELNDPNLLRAKALPPSARVELRRQQIVKLRENIKVLGSKRAELNRKIGDYIVSLQGLIASLEKTVRAEQDQHSEVAVVTPPGTQVRCLVCETERVFRDLQVIFARESDESLALPTEVYVLADGTIKKGRFACGACGTESLVIRSC